MDNTKRKICTAVFVTFCCVITFLGGWFFAKQQTPETTTGAAVGEYISNPKYEHLVGAAIYQLSAESDALILQSYDTVKKNVSEMLLKCADENQPEWEMKQNSQGENEMYHQGKRVAIITDIDDTLVNGVNYTADILGNDGDWNNAAFARFLMSSGCTALPGAVDCMQFCKDSGIEIYYVTNRYDQGYKVGQSDSHGSYDQFVKEHGEEGTYFSKEGKLIGTSVYQLYGKSMYDISLESMRKLGFPVDDQHLIVNDNKLMGGSKEKARQAIINGCKDYSNGQREKENSLNTKLTFSCDAHDVVMLMGDQITDFTDEFDQQTTTAIERRQRTSAFKEKFGHQWILFPNAVYGKAIDTGKAYGAKALFQKYAYPDSLR